MGRGGHAAADGDFFPLFTLLEDLRVLPRIAFNLDKGFARRNACGKRAFFNIAWASAAMRRVLSVQNHFGGKRGKVDCDP